MPLSERHHRSILAFLGNFNEISLSKDLYDMHNNKAFGLRETLGHFKIFLTMSIFEGKEVLGLVRRVFLSLTHSCPEISLKSFVFIYDTFEKKLEKYLKKCSAC